MHGGGLHVFKQNKKKVSKQAENKILIKHTLSHKINENHCSILYLFWECDFIRQQDREGVGAYEW